MEITNWDNHWKENKNDPLLGVENPQNWSDLQWLHTLYILDLQINAHLQKYKNITMLECGAGTAGVSRYFNKKYQFKNIILDNSIEALKTGENFIKYDNLKIKTILSDIKNMPFDDNSFDIIYLGGVMEYLDDYDLCIAEIKRVLKPEGMLLFVVVPNVINIQIIGDLFLFLKNIFKKQQTKLVPSNVKKWHAKKYMKILIKNRFDKIKDYYLNPFPLIPLPKILKYIYIYILIKLELSIKRYNLKTFYLKRYLAISFLIKAHKSI